MFRTPRNKRIDSALESLQVRKHSFLRFEEMQDILILFDYADWDEIEPVVKDLNSNGKHVILWTILPKNKEKEFGVSRVMSTLQQVRVVRNKEISWYRGLSGIVDAEFKNLKYDTLLDMTTDSDKNIFYLLASNDARFCIGIKEAGHKLYDFVLLKEDSKSLWETYNQIKFYLNNVHKDK